MKISSVEFLRLEEEVPVYDLSMCSENPCFALRAGVISHNTISAGSSVRQAILPVADNYVLNHSDFSQMELTCIAYYSQDENMINAFKEGKDMHRFTAAMAFNKPYEEVTSEERRSAKGINFGIVYQQGLATLAMNTTGGDIEAAQKLMDQF